MPIPDFQTIMKPLLLFTSDRKEHSLQETVEHISSEFNLTEDEKRSLTPTGRLPYVHERTGWAVTYLRKSGLIRSTRRGWFEITPQGLDVLKRNPEKIDAKFLEEFPEYRAFRSLTHKMEESISKKPLEPQGEQPPEEVLEHAYLELQSSLAEEILERVKEASPQFFERLVVDLLIKMGYGGSRKEAGEAIGGTGDEGIDGIIKEDKLGLDVIYMQAKRWNAQVGRPQIQNFVGALHGKGAARGILITTSSFSDEALKYADSIKIPKVILIDGANLAKYMIEFDVGVSTVSTYTAKKIDADYFEQ